MTDEPLPEHVRPDGVTDATVEALGRLSEALEAVEIARGRLYAFHRMSGTADRTLGEADPADYYAAVLPGGVANPDQLRTKPEALDFLRAIAEAGKPMGVICHAPWMLVESGLVRGRTVTSWPSLQTDIRNAGGTWVDEEVHVDGNLVTSRKPDDIPAFNREILALFARFPQDRHQAEAA